MLAAGHRAFYQRETGRTRYYDFASQSYRELTPGAGVVSLPALKGSGKTALTCPSASLVDIGDDVFCLEFHTKMNALNAEIIEFMGRSLDFVEQNGAGLVLGNDASGMPGAFSAGADLVQVGTAARQGQFEPLDRMIDELHAVVQRERYAAFPVVAAPYGLTLGGGCEVCLAADRIVAHAELYMGLVEIGVGLLPGGGGCLNLWKKMTAAIPEAVIDLDLAKFFVPTFMAIAMAKVSSSAAEARANGFLGPQDRIVFSREHLIGEAKKEVLRMVDAGYVPPARRKLKVFGEAAQGMINGELFNMQSAGFVSEYDVYLARRIAFVISGGAVRTGSEIDEQVILKLEKEAFLEFLHQEKSLARIEHMLKTGKPLRN
jgi:3-hydroxyacyl-CoA dehydrogenase